MRKDESLRIYPSINKAKKLFNWKIKNDFNYGLKKQSFTIKIMSELVSIIINCHNGEKFLQRCLQSVINQNYKNWEIIFWNNNSTDNSKKIFQSYND